MRIDRRLVLEGYFQSRNKAVKAIDERRVLVRGSAVEKPSEDVSGDDEITVLPGDGYVSRGAYKLLQAFDEFKLDVRGESCLDVGASTGGFTQVLLMKGASRVAALDVGTDQLDSSLLCDERVVSLQNVNARYISAGTLPFAVTTAVMDVSFISQSLIYGALSSVLPDGGKLITLVKPQFECGRSKVGKNGIVRDEKGLVIAEIKQRLTLAAAANRLILQGFCVSPVKGGDGNTEYLAYFVKENQQQ